MKIIAHQKPSPPKPPPESVTLELTFPEFVLVRVVAQVSRADVTDSIQSLQRGNTKISYALSVQAGDTSMSNKLTDALNEML